MHYFSPVHKMPLLEVVVTDKTAPWVTVTAVALGKKQGKTVIVVRDGAGFYTTRILAPYLNEASFLLSEGIAIDKIDDALVAWGFPIGPLALLDEVGIDVGGKVAAVMYEAFGERVLPPLTMQELISDQRFGKKNKRGFYVYEGKKIRGKRSVDPSVYALLKTDGNTEVTATTIVQRAVLAMVNEAARCLGEGILQSPRDGDIGAVFGLGFPPFRGGPFRYIDTVGAEQIVRRLERYQKEHGVRFEPAPALVEMAKSGARYYGQRRTHSVAPSDAAASSP
jgi:3-hydroxyacyl-CoA dehydrogenase/enoyl-CoA hydratase/3-hydroxybutyryl-CoA epimerase